MKFKKFLLPVLLLTIIIAGTAFTQIGKSRTVTKAKNTNVDYSYWFSYVGPSPVYYFSDLTNPNNYVFLQGDHNPFLECEYGTDTICMILCERSWNGFSWKPTFSNTSYGSAYWGLSNFYSTGTSGTYAVQLKSY